MNRTPLLLLAALALAGCDQLGLNDGKAAEADGKAIGAACRHAGRALEDCYQLNPTASKAAVFAGWKEMNDYMTEQKLEVVKPTLPPPVPKTKGKKKASEDADANADEAPSDASVPKGDTDKAGEGGKPGAKAGSKASGKEGGKEKGAAKGSASAPDTEGETKEKPTPKDKGERVKG